jgi:hypothetical protein
MIYWKRKVRQMKRKTTEYSSEVDALVALAKRLAVFEIKERMESEDFFNQYRNGQLEDSEAFVEWANTYQHYLAMRGEIEDRLEHAA